MPGPETLSTGWGRLSTFLGVVSMSLGAGAMGCGTAPMQFYPSAVNPHFLVHLGVGHMSNLDARPCNLVHRLG
jgi:hypothetical protein